MKQIIKPTVRDVARESGVSLGTVSRVLHGETNVRADIREKVQNAINRLGYDPLKNMPLAAKARTRSIALVIPWSSPSIQADAFYGTAMLSLKAALSRHRCNMLLFSEQEMRERTRKNGSTPMDGTDAYVFFCTLGDMDPVMKTLLNRNRPCALIRRRTRVPGVVTVGDNDERAARNVMEHLYARGHRNIGMVLHRKSPVFAGREAGYRAFVREHGLPERFACLGDGDRSGLAGIAAEMLGSAEPPTAFFCTDDYTAITLIGILRERGLRVPDDVAVAGYNNSEAGRMFYPALTTVRIPVPEMIAQAAGQLIETLDGARPCVTRIELEAELIVRASTSADAL